MNALESLRQVTTIVADTGSLARIREVQPQDATTNPSLILKAMSEPEGRALANAVQAGLPQASADARLEALVVAFGLAILKLIPGRVSSEVDARLAFDVEATVAQAMSMAESYDHAGVPLSRVLIKLPATWEGIRAAEKLSLRGVACNMTLIFSMAQASACADAGVQLISPFVGRISDWFKQRGETWARAEDDPGVRFVRAVFEDYKARGVSTEIMGASFRSVEQVMALAGCDLLTVSPDLLDQLAQRPAMTGPTPLQADTSPEAQGRALAAPWRYLHESAFRYQLNDDAMASEKLAEGIRLFARDGAQLLALLASNTKE
ncbi:MAG: transaldolase family protein [Burkholderiaceae bacterium]